MLDKNTLEDLFNRLADKLERSTRLCLFGSAPGILLGQPKRTTEDLDMWRASSTYDPSNLKRAMSELGVLWNPMHPPKDGPVYLQVVVPGVVNFPRDLETVPVYQRGPLTIVMPTPVMLSASKLVRGNDKDIEDICWWLQERSMSLRHLEQSGVNRLANAQQREHARGQLALVRLHLAKEYGA